MTGRSIAIVDPVSLAGPFGAQARAMGLSPIAVMTQEFTEPYVVQSFQRDRYEDVYRHVSIEDTAAYLKRQGVAAVVPGTTPSLAVVDALADALGLIGNPTATAEARRNKRIMKEHWAARGVPCAAWCESGDLGTLAAWAHGQGYPVVLKPNASSGSSHVYLCADERELARAFATITGGADMWGRRYDTVLAEEYLDGDEYFMDLLHNGDEHGQLVAVARYEKIQRDGHASIYRTFRSLPLDDPVVSVALPYVQAVNAALDVRYGINDTEFKLTSRGPRVIEVNNRLPGAGTAAMIERCSGLNCFQEVIRIFLGEYTPPREPYRYARHYCACCLINDRAGRVLGYRGVEEVRRLPSYDSMRLIAQVGRDWPATRDLSTAWGIVWLTHDDPAQLDRDAEAVHGLMRLRQES